MAAAADQRQFSPGEPELRELVEQQLVVGHVGRQHDAEIRPRCAERLHQRGGIRDRRRVHLVHHRGQAEFLQRVLAHLAQEADIRRGVVGQQRDLGRPLPGRLLREIEDRRQQLPGLAVGGRRRLKNIVKAAAGDQIGIGQREPWQRGALRHLGGGEREAGEPAAEAADQVGLLRHHALRRVLGLFRRILRVELHQPQLRATQRVDAAGGVDVVDRHLGAELFQNSRARPGSRQRDQHGDLHLLRRRGPALRAGATRDACDA